MTIRCRETLAIEMPELENITIRKVGVTHLSGIAEIERACFAEPWSQKSLELLLREENTAFVALCGETPVAYCGMLTVLDEGQITNIAVLPEYRRRGIGKRLLLSIMEEAKKRDLSVISLEVRMSNQGALALYAACGWKQAGERKNFYRFPTESAVVMLCDLSEI